MRLTWEPPSKNPLNSQVEQVVVEAKLSSHYITCTGGHELRMCQDIFYSASKVKHPFSTRSKPRRELIALRAEQRGECKTHTGLRGLQQLTSGLIFGKDRILPGNHPSSYTVEQSSYHPATSVRVCVSLRGCASFSKDFAPL